MKNEKETTFLKTQTKSEINVDDKIQDSSSGDVPLVKYPFSSDIFKQDVQKILYTPTPIKIEPRRPSKIEQLIEQKLKEKKEFFLEPKKKLDKTNEQKFNKESQSKPVQQTDTSLENTKPNIINRKSDTVSINSMNNYIHKKRSRPVVLETPNYDFIETPNIKSPQEITENQIKKKNKKRFRAKLTIVVYSIILTICAGWAIFNAFQISNTANNISNINYSISELNYIIKIEQLDIINDHENSIITNIIEVAPSALAEPTTVQPQTNWFDRICTWISKLFK